VPAPTPKQIPRLRNNRQPSPHGRLARALRLRNTSGRMVESRAGEWGMTDPELIKRALKGGPVDNDIELAAAIGRCSNNWAHAESRLTILFCILSRTDLTTGVIIFSHFKATRVRSDVLKRLGRLSTLMTPERLELLNSLLKEYQSLADERNQLIHNPIGMGEELYIMLRDKAPLPDAIPYKTEPISIDQIDDLSERISTFNLKATILNRAMRKIPDEGA
jgi:hypothetical protein